MTLNRWKRFSVLRLLLLLALSGCHQNGSIGKKIDSPNGADSAHTDLGHSGLTGTVDGGGGAGIDGRPIESYRQDITKLPEYQHVVAPVIKSLQRLRPEFAKLFLHIVNDKTWLFLNRPIPKLSGERQGIPSNFNQWGAQGNQSIWFSDKYQGSEEDRGKILLHEIFVGLKIMRFLSYNEYCRSISNDPTLCHESRNEPLKAEPKLSAADHDDARKMVTWLLDNHKTMTETDFADQMHIYQFQGPHYNWRFYVQLLQTHERLMNPTIERLFGQKVMLFSGFDINHVAKQRCEVEFGPLQDKHFKVTIILRNLEDKKELRRLQRKFYYDPNSPHKVVETPSEHYYNLEFNENKPMKSIAESQFKMNLDIDQESIIQLDTGLQVIRQDRKGEIFRSTNIDGPNAASCSFFPFDRPLNENVWYEMRPEDREFLERHYFNGKTKEEIFTDFSAKYGISFD